MKNLAIIPARSGSKGLVDKNIKLLEGRPLMAYSIEAAKASGCFDTIHLSTDSEQYSQIGQKYGAEVPFLRSEELSSDKATTWDAVRFVLEKYKELGKTFDTVCILQPTSPLREAADIQKAYEVMEEKQAKSIVSLCIVDHSPVWSNTLPENHALTDFIKEEARITPRQELPDYYRINGAIYITRTDLVFEKKDIYKEEAYGYIMPKERSVDIDDSFDFLLAQTLLQNKLEK